MVTTRRIEKRKLERKYGIRKCTVKLSRLTIENSTSFRNALFRKYGVRDLIVKLHRVTSTPKMKLLSDESEMKSVRSLVPWLPTTSSPRPTTSAIISGNQEVTAAQTGEYFYMSNYVRLIRSMTINLMIFLVFQLNPIYLQNIKNTCWKSNQNQQ